VDYRTKSATKCDDYLLLVRRGWPRDGHDECIKNAEGRKIVVVTRGRRPGGSSPPIKPANIHSTYETNEPAVWADVQAGRTRRSKRKTSNVALDRGVIVEGSVVKKKMAESCWEEEEKQQRKPCAQMSHSNGSRAGRHE
jgi:hypothetical protein